uniref:hypothetical protein n=1 Tax=Agathobacter sp. TaxID=2021311 RepID=UPI004056303C
MKPRKEIDFLSILDYKIGDCHDGKEKENNCPCCCGSPSLGINYLDGVVAPNQGLFPKYDAGLYTEENTNMIVSRGCIS